MGSDGRFYQESVFSDLNNLEVVTTTSEKYADCFGFTEEEVFAALEEYGLSDYKEKVRDWFAGNDDYNDFIKALLLGDVKAMNHYMNRVTAEMFSYFDMGTTPQGEPERFYRGFVLGLMVELADRYVITSNRESGFGRYDVMLEPRIWPGKQDRDVVLGKDMRLDTIIIEFKVQEADEKELSDTARDALRQIEERAYQAALTARGIPKERIRKYGFAFCGKRVFIVDVDQAVG